MTNRKSTTGFPTSYRWSAYVTLGPFNFNPIKSATKFCCVKTFSGEVVEQSIGYEITEKYRT